MSTRLSGLLSARPTPQSCVGARYYATDVPQVYVSYGNQWLVHNILDNADVAGFLSGANLAARPSVPKNYLGYLWTDAETGNQYEAFPTAWALVGDLTPALIASDATMGVVIHGADANVDRPVGLTVVTWIGSVEPVNALDNDVWEEPGVTAPQGPQGAQGDPGEPGAPGEPGEPGATGAGTLSPDGYPLFPLIASLAPDDQIPYSKVTICLTTNDLRFKLRKSDGFFKTYTLTPQPALTYTFIDVIESPTTIPVQGANEMFGIFNDSGGPATLDYAGGGTLVTAMPANKLLIVLPGLLKLAYMDTQ